MKVRTISMSRFFTSHHPKKPCALIVAASMLLSACSIVGVRTGTEQPPYSLIGAVGNDIELREYQERLTARVTLENEETGARKRNAAFLILADYIFGNNRANTKLAMTAPVAAQVSSEKIAMTAPVAADTGADGPYTMSFFLPRTFTLETAPIPVDPRVELVNAPAAMMAALRFSGSRDDQRIDEFKARLLQALNSSEWQTVGKPIAYFYDPPWTIPSFRRNEVAVAVTPRAAR
jgi:hypothetical protein